MTTEQSLLDEFQRPLFFDVKAVSQALDTYDPADPHRRDDEFDDPDVKQNVVMPLYDLSIVNPVNASNLSLSEFPDYSDKVLSDYKIQKMLGRDIAMPAFVDLDTADNYVGFIQNSVKNVLASENEFNMDQKKA